MVVCHCNAVSDREIRSAVASGAMSADDVARRCSAGTRCGSCVPVVQAILSEVAVSISFAA